jgi:pyridoxal phosphate enzyme (YggS family)
MTIRENLERIKSTLPPGVTLVAVTKTHPPEKLMEVYDAGHAVFGENKVQELVQKQLVLPKDIQWHLIGHLQTNKVKEIASFVHLIHSADSLKLLKEIDKQASKNNRVIDCLLQLYIASEETKFGLDFTEAETLLRSTEFAALKHIRITGLMGMASNTDKREQVRLEFRSLKNFFEKLKTSFPETEEVKLHILSMGMSSDYALAIEEGSNLVRVGSAIFGNRE